jgi:general secretion pathway protein E
MLFTQGLPESDDARRTSEPLGCACAAQGGEFGVIPLQNCDFNHLTPNFESIGFAECQRRKCLIATRGSTEHDSHETVFLVCDPLANDLHQWAESRLELLKPKRVIRAVTDEVSFTSFLEHQKAKLRAMDSMPDVQAEDGNQGPANRLHLSIASIEQTENPTVRLVDATLYDALKLGASDIHFELQQRTLYIKYRLDGVLQDIKSVDSLDAAHQAVSRIKVLSDLDISEHRVPQDGRFRVVLEDREVDFRVSIMPNAVGEDAVLRILDRRQLTGQFSELTLDALSFEHEVKTFIRTASRLPYGLLLVTGPTGSGKTTTLYAAITEINTGLDKIVTIEDPIEYQLPRVLQIPVNEKKGLTFARGLRSILRHDPDKIMVGEIRDSETAQIAVQAALTGHQVFTTVHANNVFDVIGRFSNMGVDSYSLVAALSGIVAQRLVRTVCQHCAKPHVLSSEELEMLELSEAETCGHVGHFSLAVGCERCRGTGYSGRSAIAEVLPIDDEMKNLLVQHAPIGTLKAAARQNGFRSLRQSALALASRGLTTLDEINRVTPLH